MINPETEIQLKEKQYKQSPEVRKYFREYHKKRRLKNARCDVCGGQAILKTLRYKTEALS